MKISDFRLPIVFCLMALHASGFEATMTIQPPLIQLGETATLSIEVRGSRKVQPPALPNVPGLRFSGASQSQQSSWVNGKSDSFTSFSYQIAPQQTGTFSIGPFNYTIDGESKTLQGELKVVATSGDASQPQSWSEILFARLEPDRTSAYVQEPFGLMLSVYSRQGVQLAGNINMQGMPGTGLSELKWQEIQPTREVVSNAVYNVQRFYSQARAMSSGIFEFKPSITVQVVIQNKNNRSNDPFFGSMFQRTETRPVDLPVEKVAVAVKPLPDEGRPAGFSGAVGQFAFQVSAQPLNVQPGDPVTLTMTISGDGNFDRVTMPPLPPNGQFKFFGEPVRKQEDKAVLFEQVVSPRTADITEIPPISFSFFDTQAGRYRTVTNPAIPITVTATSNSTAQVFAAKDSIISPPPETPFATESDLQRIEGQVKSLWQTVRPWLWALPSALFIGLAVLSGRKIYQARQNDTARVRKQKAPKIARKALAAAEHARQKGDLTSFYDALWNALAGYFSHRLNLEPGNVSALTVLTALERTGLDPEPLNCLRNIFEQVEASRYGLPGREMSSLQLERLQTDLAKVLKTCDRAKL